MSGERDGVSRRGFGRQLFGAAAATAGGRALAQGESRQRPSAGVQDHADDPVTYATIADLRAMMERGELTALELAKRCLNRAERIDRRGPMLRSIIEINPDALSIAEKRDDERKRGQVRGPLHGIPVLVKDNIDTADRMATSAGSLALASSRPLRDAFVIERLRGAGAVLLGKTNLSEWAAFRSPHATSGWSARGGQTQNPHVLDRNPSGSSSGSAVAVAAGLAPAAVGTETDGSIISPSSICGIVGIKPTLGLCSRAGLIPIAASQDTPGPMARGVADAAILLGVLAGVDGRDPATNAATGHMDVDYTRRLDRAALKGARIGVPRNLAGFNAAVDRALDAAVEALRTAGAVVVDDLKLPTAGKFDEPELEVLIYEFAAGMESYLASLGPAAPAKSLADLIAFNQKERARELVWFGQELFERAARARPPRADDRSSAAYRSYRAARSTCLRMTRRLGLDPLLKTHKLDALVCPPNQPAWLTDLVNGDHITGGNTSFAAVSGYPSITVPMGAFAEQLPLGLAFIGPPWSEGRLIALAYAFEQHTKAAVRPRFLPTLELRTP